MAKEAVQEGTGINAAKLKALQATIDKIEKDYGKGTIMKLGEFRFFNYICFRCRKSSAGTNN